MIIDYVLKCPGCDHKTETMKFDLTFNRGVCPWCKTKVPFTLETIEYWVRTSTKMHPGMFEPVHREEFLLEFQRLYPSILPSDKTRLQMVRILNDLDIQATDKFGRVGNLNRKFLELLAANTINSDYQKMYVEELERRDKVKAKPKRKGEFKPYPRGKEVPDSAKGFGRRVE